MNNTRAYIKKQLKKGVSEQDILEALKTSGHEPTAANKAIQETRKAIKRLHRIVVVLAALLAIAVVLLIATNYQAQTQENQPPTQTPTTPQEPAEQLTEQEIIIQAIQENNPALCEELQGDWREECEAEFSTAEEYTPTSEEEIIIQAIQENNPALCEELQGDWREECQAEFTQETTYQPSPEEEIIIQAIQENNPALCEELEDEHWREECYAEVQ